MSKFMNSLTSILLATAFVVCSFAATAKAEKPADPTNSAEYVFSWSIYAGWQPYAYMDVSKIVDKWAKKYNTNIKIRKFISYLPSIEDFVAGNSAGCAMTNMEALDMPAAGGIDCTVIIMGDYSNGNDACLVRNRLTVSGLTGKKILLVEKSVSHYLLVRKLEKEGLKESDVHLAHTDDSDIQNIFVSNPNEEVVVTWNPMVMTIAQEPDVQSIFDSSEFPGEIQDLMVVRTEIVQQHPEVIKALVGAWYEVMEVMQQRNLVVRNKALKVMADEAGCELTEYVNQLKTTMMFYNPADATSFTESQEIKDKTDLVRRFCASHDLLGENEKNPDVVGIMFPDGTVMGDPNNVKLRFDSSFMRMAADGKL